MESARKKDGRQRLIIGAITLLRERGLSGASFGEVTKRSGAPRGSIYHHFPGGKEQLMIEAVDLAGVAVEGLIEQAGDDPRKALDGFISAWRSQLVESDFSAGCPIVGVASELGPDQDQLAAATARAFDLWQTRFASILVLAGIDGDEAGRLATLVIASVEGAVILSRSKRNTIPLDDIGTELDALLADRLG